MKGFKYSAWILFGLGLAFMASGCTGKSARNADDDNVDSTTPSLGGGGGSGGGCTNNCTGLPPNFQRIELSGIKASSRKSYTLKFLTDNRAIVYVKLASDIIRVNGGGNFNERVTCASFDIFVNGHFAFNTGPIQPSSGSSLCAGAPTMAILDVSRYLNFGSADLQSVTIKHATYDYYCKLFQAGYNIGGDYNSNCPLRDVYKNHYLTVDLAVEGNDTGGI